MGDGNSQKDVKNQRVQITYDLENEGAEGAVEIPFVMVTMADLSGANAGDLPALADRDLVEISAQNFDEVMKSAKPRVKFRVPNMITGEGELSIDQTFTKMSDFSPAEVLRQGNEATRKLLEERERLSNLLSQLDGQAAAEAELTKLLQDRARVEALAGGEKKGE